jgi:NADH pyrophosphatase NudC (nudix superfamily)
MTALTVGFLGGTALVAFLAGLFSFKVKNRWCPRCGANTLPQRPEKTS